MITIYAEKPDVGNKIAAALDKITLSSGKEITFKDLKANEKAVKSQQYKDGYLKIKFKGEDCYVTWGYGHLCELKQASDYNSDYKNWNKMPMPFIPSKYEIKVKDEVKKQFNLVKDLMNKSSLVINATDYDREGELIFAYLYEAAKLTVPFKRAYFSSQTKEGFIEAFDNLKTPAEVKSITDAGRGRSIADFVVGANLTAQMTLKSGTKNVLSIGRVQTPTLNILVERELAIKHFVPTPYYTITANFETASKETYKADYKVKKITKKDTAQEILDKIKGHKGVVKDIQRKTEYKEGPSLYSLSSLQMATNSKYGLTMAKTLEIVQQLYEAGYTTYPRTDSQYLTEDMEPVVNNVLDVLSANNEDYHKLIDKRPRKFDRPKYFDDKKVVSHFAIIPTKSYPKSGLTPQQEKVYDLIARSVITMLYGDAKLENTKVTTVVNGEEFISSGKMVIDPQWMLVDSRVKDELLPTLNVSDEVNGEYKMSEKMTQPPKRYTDKTLLSAMLNSGKELDDAELKKLMATHDIKGIGTEATRASIIETLVRRGYVDRDKKTIFATDKGIQLINALPIKEIKSAELTALWEKRLYDIELGKEDLPTFVKDIEEITKKWVYELGTTVKRGDVASYSSIGTCPLCGKGIIKTKWGYGCSGYKDGCKFTISGTIAGKKLTDTQVKKLLTKGSTGLIKGFKSSSGKTFNTELVFDDDHKVIFEFAKSGPASSTPEETDIVCPKCGKKVMNTAWSYKCDCGFMISKKISNRTMTEEEIKDLIANKKTKKLTGFRSKANKPFSATLLLDEDYKIKFNFD